MTVTTVTAGSCFSGGHGDEPAWPPGFRFHPTDDELVLYYLKRKICGKRLIMNVIRDLDVYKWDPEELPALSILRTGDRIWFFFSPRDRKYPNGARSNRATRQGYWKATGKDRNITCYSRNVGVKKTLVFYRGRAPTGVRTDWVMHEYTLDEEELRRCPNIQEYYALYKLYKKSGPGPKNGEQYGAPFKEEDWLDDGDDANNPVTEVIPVKQQHHEVTPVGIVGPAGPLDTIDIEEILNQIDDEPASIRPQNCDNTYLPSLVAGEEEVQSASVSPSLENALFSEPTSMLPVVTNCQQYDLPHASLDFNQSAASDFQLHEALEVTSATEDFLEINDLLGPEPANNENPVENLLSNNVSNVENPVTNWLFDDFDGLAEFDFYQDASMFLHDVEPADQETVSDLTSLGNDMENRAGCQLQSHSVANHENHLLQSQSMANQVNYQLQSQLYGEDQMISQLWVHDQRSYAFSSPDSNHGTLAGPTTGHVYQSTNNTNGEEGGASSGWLSSAIWSFVDTIPTRPASASERPLVNKALERMSSFSKLGMNVVKRRSADAGNDTAEVKGYSGNRSFLLLSLFGVLLAVLCIFMGNLRVWEMNSIGIW